MILRRYVFYTETSTQWAGGDRRKNKAFDKKTGKIGEHGRSSYYLLYEPNNRLDAGLDAKFLAEVAVHDPNPVVVVYAERVWVHRDQLRRGSESTASGCGRCWCRLTSSNRGLGRP